jgi:hypothetical protein
MLRAVADVSASLAPLTPAKLQESIARALKAAQRLRQRPVDDVIAMLDSTVARFLRADDPLRLQAEAQLPGVTGFSSSMIRHGLPRLLEPLRGADIAGLLDAELGNRRVLDGWCDGRRAHGPGLVVHVLSGNIPALGAAPTLLSLALKSAVLVKPAAGDPLFPELLQAALTGVDPDLAECVVVAPWRGGDLEIEDAVFAMADLVVASGSDAAIAAIRSRVPGRFIGHGHKVSFAVVGRECLSDEQSAADVARRLAYDVTLWDQQGCLSPQLCYVEAGGGVSLATFADLLGEALSVLTQELPPRALSFEEKAAILRFRQEAEWSDGASLLSSQGTEWSISVEPGYDLKPTCLNRCLRLMKIDNVHHLGETLSCHRRYLEAAGLACNAARLPAIAALLSEAGVHRVCRLGTMQTPSLSWRQSGRPRVAEWVEWTSTEPSAV